LSDLQAALQATCTGKMNSSDLSLRIASTITGCLHAYGTQNMTVACDGGAGAQAGVRHSDGPGTCRPNRAPGNTHRGLSFASYGPCSSLLHRLVRAEVTVSCAGLQMVQRRCGTRRSKCRIQESFFENGEHQAVLRATQSPMACVQVRSVQVPVRWVGSTRHMTVTCEGPGCSCAG
jgi:hypothetical protein